MGTLGFASLWLHCATVRSGRFIPDDWGHLDAYPLTAETQPTEPRPVVIGVLRVARGGAGSLTVRTGGHCVCLEPGGDPDREEWWDFYDQGREGACVGFGWSRCMSILNNELYSARWLWDRSKERDQWSETNPGDNEGTSVRAAGEVLAAMGHVVTHGEPVRSCRTTGS